MSEQEASYTVSEARRRFSELIGRVTFGKETILIKRRDTVVASIQPKTQNGKGDR